MQLLRERDVYEVADRVGTIVTTTSAVGVVTMTLDDMSVAGLWEMGMNLPTQTWIAAFVGSVVGVLVKAALTKMGGAIVGRMRREKPPKVRSAILQRIADRVAMEEASNDRWVVSPDTGTLFRGDMRITAKNVVFVTVGDTDIDLSAELPRWERKLVRNEVKELRKYVARRDDEAAKAAHVAKLRAFTSTQVPAVCSQPTGCDEVPVLRKGANPCVEVTDEAREQARQDAARARLSAEAQSTPAQPTPAKESIPHRGFAACTCRSCVDNKAKA